MDTMRRRLLPALILSSVFVTAVAAAEQPVTLEQFQAHPDDKQLSYSFARQQVRAGQLPLASMALQRVLQIDPDWDAARLFHATVLFRLQDYEGARAELAVLAERPLSTDQQEEVARYLGLVDARTGQVGEPVAFMPVATPKDAIASFELLDVGQSGQGPSPAPNTRIATAFLSGLSRIHSDAVRSSHTPALWLGQAETSELPLSTEADTYASAGAQSVSLGAIEVSAEVLSMGYEASHTRDVAELQAEYPLGKKLSLVAGGQVGTDRVAGVWGLAEASQHSSVSLELRGQSATGPVWSAGAALMRIEETAAASAMSGFEVRATGTHFLGMGQFLLGEVWYGNLRDPAEPDASEWLEGSAPGVRLTYGTPLAIGAAMQLPALHSIGEFNLLLAGAYEVGNSGAVEREASPSAEVLLTKHVAF